MLISTLSIATEPNHSGKKSLCVRVPRLSLSLLLLSLAPSLSLPSRPLLPLTLAAQVSPALLRQEPFMWVVYVGSR